MKGGPAFHRAIGGIAFPQGPQWSIRYKKSIQGWQSWRTKSFRSHGFSTNAGWSAFQIKLLIWSSIVLIDGYDIAAIAFAAPSLVKEWALKPGALGPVFSASLVGILFGSALFGWIGDRYGRKAALVWSNLLFGVFTLAAAYARF